MSLGTFTLDFYVAGCIGGYCAYVRLSTTYQSRIADDGLTRAA
jgi:hypothetical protein